MPSANILREWYSPAIYFMRGSNPFMDDPDADCPRVDVPNTEEEEEPEGAE